MKNLCIRATGIMVLCWVGMFGGVLHGEVIRLSSASGISDFAVAESVGRVVYSRNGTGMFSALLTEPGSELLLSDPFPNANPLANPEILRFAVTPSGTRAVYLGTDLDQPGFTELFSVSTTAAGTAMGIDQLTKSANYHVEDFRMGAVDDLVIFLGATVPSRDEILLNAVSASGGESYRLSPTPNPGGNIVSFQISTDGARVLFLGDVNVDDQFQLFSSSTAGGGAITVSQSATGASVEDYAFSPDGSLAAYVGELVEVGRRSLFVKSVSGGAQTRVDFDALGSGEVQKLIPPRLNNRIVYVADLLVNGRMDLWSADPTASPAVNVHLNNLPSGSVVVTPSTPQMTPNGTHVLFSKSEVPRRLYSVSSTLPGTEIEISSGANGNGEVDIPFAPTPDGTRVAYLGDLDIDSQQALYIASVSSAGTQKRLFQTDSSQTISEWMLSEDGSQIILRVLVSGPDPRSQVWTVGTTGAPSPVLIAESSLGFSQIGFSPTKAPLFASDGLFTFLASLPPITPVPPTPPPATDGRPKISLKGKKKLLARRQRVVLRGEATDDMRIARVEVQFKNGRKRVTRRANLKGNGNWQFVSKGRSRIRKLTIVAVDSAGQQSKPIRVRIQVRR